MKCVLVWQARPRAEPDSPGGSCGAQAKLTSCLHVPGHRLSFLLSVGARVVRREGVRVVRREGVRIVRREGVRVVRREGVRVVRREGVRVYGAV